MARLEALDLCTLDRLVVNKELCSFPRIDFLTLFFFADHVYILSRSDVLSEAPFFDHSLELISCRFEITFAL